MKVAVIGANGQLGVDVCAAFRSRGHAVVEMNHDRIDIAVLDSVRSAMDAAEPDLVVNTASMHHVDRCEEDPQAAFAVNAVGARNLAVVSKETGCPLVHLSTDYVFDGAKQKPYFEYDLPLPLNVYGTTKLAGEHMIQATAPKHFIVRTSGLYGLSPCRAKGTNFVELMIRLAVERGRLRVVDDEILTPTYTVDLADAIVRLSETHRYGLYHATAEGNCSWHAFAWKILELAGIGVVPEVAAPGEFPNKTPRPSYSVLENGRMKSIGIGSLPRWESGLSRYIQARASGNAIAV